MENGEIRGLAADALVEFYLGSRGDRTLPTYEAGFRRVWQHSLDIRCPVFRWGEGEAMGLLIKLEGQGIKENGFKQCMAVLNIIFECLGRESPSKSALVSRIKKTCIKKSNVKKNAEGKKKERGLAKISDIKKMLADLYKNPASEVEPARRRFLVQHLLLFFGMKRFSDIAELRVKDFMFKSDGSVEVFMRKSKTDTFCEGQSFFLSGKKIKKICLPEIIVWYFKSLGLKDEDVAFPRFRRSKGKEVVPIKHISVSYSTSNFQLKKEIKNLRLGKISLHSGRIGAATAAAEAGLSREFIKPCGGWKSDQVDVYIRPQRPGVVFNDCILSRF